MDLNILIKILGIVIIVTCCIIATYTDVKWSIIPNKLTLTTILIGLILVSTYYFLINSFNLFYYISVIVTFIISYILWYLGVWAGGDVKLLTAISTLFIPEFLDIIPQYSIGFLHLPFYFLEGNIPSLWVIVNSIISVLPLIVMIMFYIILKRKSFLIKELKKTIKINEGMFNLTLLIIIYTLIDLIHVDNILLKLGFMFIFLFLMNKFFKENKPVIILSTIVVLLFEFINGNLLIFLSQFIVVEYIIIIRHIMKNKLFNKVFTDYYDVNCLNEGMILSYNLCRKNNSYYFKDLSLFGKLNNNDEVIIYSNAAGLENKDISLLKKLNKNNYIENVPIKKGIPFAPFILMGVMLTLFFGNTFQLFSLLLELV
ncbi:prepilin peptidase [Methanosphaera sp.]